MITAAFSSDEIDVPSWRPNGFFVRTTTARTTLALLDGALRRRGLDRADDDVAYARVAAVVAAHQADAQQLAGAGVVGDLRRLSC